MLARLRSLIYRSLGPIKEEAKSRFERTIGALASLPEPPPAHPNLKLIELIADFCKEFSDCVDGREGHEKLMVSCRRVYKKFKEGISSTHPNFVPFPKSSREAKRGWKLTLNHEDDHIDSSSPNDETKPLRMDLDDVSEHIEE